MAVEQEGQGEHVGVTWTIHQPLNLLGIPFHPLPSLLEDFGSK